MARQNLDQVVSGKFNPVKITKEDINKGQAWFNDRVRQLGDRVSPNALMANTKRRESHIVPGYSYMFWYRAKYEDDLPYYDTFPLVLPFAADGSSFTGLNFHYLDYRIRLYLVKNLFEFANNKKLNEKTKIQFSWELVRGAAKYASCKAAVHKYLYSHVQSQFLNIPMDQMMTACLMPVERFVQGSDGYYINKNRVWLDSMRKMS